MSIFGISLFGSEHVRVETRDRHLEWSIKGCCVKTCLWLIGKRYNWFIGLSLSFQVFWDWPELLL